MRLTTLAAAALAAMVMNTAPAMAAWQEIRNPELFIVKEWPGTPTRTEGRYQTGVVGREGVPAHIFTYEEGNIVYRMLIAELDAPEYVARSASIMGECVFMAEEEGIPLANMTNRVQGGVNAVYGRLVSVDLRENGGRRQTACLFTRGRLYKIDATVLPAHGEPNSSLAIRFTNSLSFSDRAEAEPE